MRPSAWPDWLDHIWAKSPAHGEGGRAETLAQHTWYVLEQLSEFIRLRPRLPDELGAPHLWQALVWAAFLHDFGKAAAGFQASLRGGQRWPHRHEVFSLAFVDWLSRSTADQTRQWLVAAIVAHHRDPAEIERLYPPTDDPSDDQIAQCLAEYDDQTLRGMWRWLAYCAPNWIDTLSISAMGVTVPGFSPEDEAVAGIAQQGAERIYHHLAGYRRFIRSLLRSDERALVIGTLALRGHLLNADHGASAHAGNLPRPNLSVDAMLAGRHLTLDQLYAHQRQAAATRGSALLSAPTGSGKTEAALLWAAHQADSDGSTSRLFYTLPYQASMNAMQLRLSQSFGDKLVGLQHGRSLLALYRLLLERDYDNRQALREAKWMRNLARLNHQPVRVFSPYQMLKGMYRLKGYEALLTDYHNALFIFDEIHAYEVQRLALILITVKYLVRNYNARFFFMSATFPSIIRKCLTDVLGSAVEISAEPALFSTFRRHRLQMLDGELLTEPHLRRVADVARVGKSVLVVCNTVKRAQTAYDELRGRLDPARVPITLLHGRFNMRDRSAKERMIREATGSDATHRSPVVLVSTQAVEVSLDIDLDTIYSDPAPLEALVQRFGRVNRRRKQTDLAPAHVFRQPDDGQAIYDPDLIARSLAILDRENGKPIDEASIGGWLDEIYSGDIADHWQEEYRIAADEFEATCVRPLRAFAADDRLEEQFYQAFDGTEVLPGSLQAEYDTLFDDDPLRASELLVPISYRRLWQLRRANQVLSAAGIWPPVVDALYDSDLGLQ
jgi:CRISPR-associated endonuclease/helicase Cas3